MCIRDSSLGYGAGNRSQSSPRGACTRRPLVMVMVMVVDGAGMTDGEECALVGVSASWAVDGQAAGVEIHRLGWRIRKGSPQDACGSQVVVPYSALILSLIHI
eukprot:TRINITY_DN4157_c0_g1_i2.p1 TRINITY_DN4157_c0_g1~~TRINITY_DN4157_c0_g1_i2.p1  ORF type:complete len:103 (-),score=10.18 TRINITY_DN4157_c0_g1_i2:144-452(-)